MNLEAAWNTYVKMPLPWVRTLGPEYWKSQRVGDKHGPDKYKDLQPESYALFRALHQVAKPDDVILDVGCHGGRHMKALRRYGYRQVRGLDVRPSTDQRVCVGTFEYRLPQMFTHQFNVVFTFGMTIELVPPSFPICHHLARIAKKAVVLVIQEQNIPYPRLWRTEFEREGMQLLTYKHPITPGSRASLFVWVKP